MTIGTWHNVLLIMVAACFIVFGIKELAAYFVHRHWPKVRARTMTIDGTMNANLDAWSRGPMSRYEHTLSYMYKGQHHQTTLVHPNAYLREIQLRINPTNPDKAYYESGSLVFSVLLLICGFVAILMLVNNVV